MRISIAQARTKRAPGISVWHFPCEFPYKMALANPIAYDEAALRSPHKLDSVDYYALHLLLGCANPDSLPRGCFEESPQAGLYQFDIGLLPEAVGNGTKWHGEQCCREEGPADATRANYVGDPARIFTHEQERQQWAMAQAGRRNPRRFSLTSLRV